MTTDKEVRDWFAGQALIGLVANPNNKGTPTGVSKTSFDIAEAMMAERRKRNVAQQQDQMGGA